ncbi:MAG: DoxX family protein [Burkholderiales bacterium]
MTASSIATRANHLYARAEGLLDKLQSLFALAIRLYLARVFVASALVKIESWGSTLALFENEYHVPLLSPVAAAWLGTAAELGLPMLLVAGLGTRFAALALFAFNAVAVISYPDLSDAGLKDHVLWGALMLVLAVYGPGKLSADRLLAREASRA